MKKYRICFKEIRENGTCGFKSLRVVADNVIDAIHFIFLLMQSNNSTAEIYSVFYLPEGIE